MRWSVHLRANFQLLRPVAPHLNQHPEESPLLNKVPGEPTRTWYQQRCCAAAVTAAAAVDVVTD
jgi:hypothetical protein